MSASWKNCYSSDLLRIARIGKNPERQVQIELIARCRSVLAIADKSGSLMSDLKYLMAVPNDGGFSGNFKSNVVRVVNAKRMGVQKGVSDLFLPVPVLHKDPQWCHQDKTYHGLWLELKAIGKRPHPKRSDIWQAKVGSVKPEQIEWLEGMKENGYACAIAWDVDGAYDCLAMYLLGKWKQGSIESYLSIPQQLADSTGPKDNQGT